MKSKWIMWLALSWIVLPLLAWFLPWGFVFLALYYLILPRVWKADKEWLFAATGICLVILSTFSLHHLMVVWFGMIGIWAWIVPVLYIIIAYVILLPLKSN